MLGNPLPLAENPIRLAEELAMIDMISKGRLVSGFVRGGGQEQLATGVNPAFNRERFEEAHELIVQGLDRSPGPFRWEGTHYQHRVVNPWAVPLQKPLSARLDPRRASARRRSSGRRSSAIPTSRSTPSIEQTKKIWELYDEVAAEAGYTAGPENRGYLQRMPRRRDRGEGDRRTPSSSCGCRASSPASRIRCGAARRATSRRPTAAPSSSSRSAAPSNPRGSPSFEEQIARSA